MYPNISRALELLGAKYALEMLAVYNVRDLGKCCYGLPSNVPIRHVQWHKNVYNQELSEADIGIVPAVMPVRNLRQIKKSASICAEFFNDTNDDYFIRFKMPSNPGRIIVYGSLGIPVVSDFFPSAMQTIKDGENGLLAYGCGGWYHALEKLILSSHLRQRLSDAMMKTVLEDFAFDVQNFKFRQFLEKEVIFNPDIMERIFVVQQTVDLSGVLDFRKEMFAIRIRAYLRKIYGLVQKIRGAYHEKSFSLWGGRFHRKSSGEEA
jgi:hypothetical protein